MQRSAKDGGAATHCPTATAEENQVFAGPELPPHLFPRVSDDRDDTEVEESCWIGPSLPASDAHTSNPAQEFETRALRMKEKLTHKASEKPVRDKWMTEIPDRIGSDFGLPVGKTKFGDGKQKIDRTGWEKTPDGKEKISQEPMTSEGSDLSKNFCEERDRATASSVDTFSKRTRPDSLLDMHQKKLKKEKKKKIKKEKKDKKKKRHKDKKDREAEKSERLPFDRDRDLQVNVFDDAKKKALIKHSQKLTSRFTNSGMQSQFL